MHLDLAALQSGLEDVRQSPADDGKVELIVRRPAEDERETLDEAHLDTTNGLVGDAWLAKGGDPAAQVTVMNARSAALVAHSRDRWGLAGDQIYVDLNLGFDNLPPGTLLEVGSAVLEVTGKPHRGCKKFAARFGLDALRFVNSDQGYALNLRGINTRVVRSGVVRPGDVIRKVPADDAGRGTLIGQERR
jgi:MOSC domain-containing protein YiiM